MTALRLMTPNVEPSVNMQDRDSLICWLEWNDRNGCYTDEDCDNEQIGRLTLESATELYLEQNSRE